MARAAGEGFGEAGAGVRPVPETARWGDRGPLLHLAHANGFPPGAYARFAARLATGWRVVATSARPLRPGARPDAIDDWRPLADDLVETFRDLSVDGPVVAVGHSLGGVTSALAAARAPELVRALVLVDPVLFAGFRLVAWGWMRRAGLVSRLPLVRNARERRSVWPSPEAALASYAKKRLFAGFASGVLDDYVREALAEQPDGGWTLRYPTAWEARIFETAPVRPWRVIRRLRCSVLVLRGAHSDTFTPVAAARFRRELNQAVVEDVPGTSHMLPFERPEHVADRILAFLRPFLREGGRGRGDAGGG